jgi:hypothetical protein
MHCWLSNYSHIASKVKFWSGSEKKDLDFSIYSFFDKVNNKALLLQNISGFLSSNKIQQIKVNALSSVKKSPAKGIFIFYILQNSRFSTCQSNSKKKVVYASNSQSYQEISSINLNVLKIDK